LPLGFLIFIVTHWPEGRRPFFAYILSTALVLAGIVVTPELMKTLSPVFLRQHPVSAVSEAREQSANLDAEITAARETGIRLQQEIDTETQPLVAVYNDLAKRRAALKPGDHDATAAFNRDAATYTARKKQLDAEREQIKANEDQITTLLAQREALTAKAAADAGAVIVYGTQWCPACKMARDYLESKNVAFRDVDIEHSPEGADEFHQRGGTAVPLIVINGEQATGFSAAWVDAHLH